MPHYTKHFTSIFNRKISFTISDGKSIFSMKWSETTFFLSSFTHSVRREQTRDGETIEGWISRIYSKPYRAKLLRLDLLAPVSNKWLQKSWSNCASGVGRFCVSLLLLRNSSVSLHCCYDLTGFCSDQRCSGNR